MIVFLRENSSNKAHERGTLGVKKLQQLFEQMIADADTQLVHEPLGVPYSQIGGRGVQIGTRRQKIERRVLVDASLGRPQRARVERPTVATPGRVRRLAHLVPVLEPLTREITTRELVGDHVVFTHIVDDRTA